MTVTNKKNNMTALETKLRAKFPNAPDSFFRRQLADALALKQKAATALPAAFPFAIKISGKIRGGKNNMIVTRTGMHFPKPEWAKWRDATVAMIKAQLPAGWQPVNEPCDVYLEYVAGDKCRRDMPAIVDSIFHCLEKAGVVTDDTLLWITKSTRCYDKEKPMARMEFSQKRVLP